MSRVSYQAMLGDGDGRFVRLHAGALNTRRKDASVTWQVRISPRQRRWIADTATSGGVRSDAVGRAALDLLIALDLDWSAIARAEDLRAAIDAAVRVRRGGTE